MAVRPVIHEAGGAAETRRDKIWQKQKLEGEKGHENSSRREKIL